jgi:hypothetical protein
MSFLGLPMEIRTCIYRLIIPEEIEVFAYTASKVLKLHPITNPGLSLMLVNHAIKAEVEVLSTVRFLAVEHKDLIKIGLKVGPGILRFVRQFRVGFSVWDCPDVKFEEHHEGRPVSENQVNAVMRRLARLYRGCTLDLVKLSKVDVIFMDMEHSRAEIIFNVTGPRFCQNFVAKSLSALSGGGTR